MEIQKAESFVNKVKVERGQIMMVILHLWVIVCVWQKVESLWAVVILSAVGLLAVSDTWCCV